MSDRLIDRWVSGTASAEDRAELIELIETDPSLVAKLFRAAEREGDLREYFGTTRTITMPSARTNTRTFTRQRARMSPARWVPISAGIAALLFIGVLLINFLAPNQTLTPQTTPASAKENKPPTVTNPVVVKNSPAENAIITEPLFPEPAFSKDVPLPPASLSTHSTKSPGQNQVATTSKPPATAMAPKPEPLVAQVRKPQPTHAYDRLDGELKDQDNALIMRYSLRVPAVLPDNKQLGLVLVFHGAGGSEKYMADPVLNALQQSNSKPDIVVAALKSAGDDWTVDDESNIISFINWATRTYPIDPRRLVIQGTSNGGWLVNYFGSRHPELVAGVIAVCGGNGFQMPAKKPLNAAETGFEYYVAHGTADESVDVKNARRVTEALRSNGYRYVYREYPGVGHNIYGDQETRNDFAAWLTRLRHKTMPLSEDDSKALNAYKKADQAEALLLTKAGCDTLIRIGGLPAEKILARAMRSKNTEVRARAISVFAETSCMPGASKIIASGLDDKDAAVRIAAIKTLSRVGDWNDQDALIALCRFAGDRKVELSERLLTVESLTQSIAMRCSPTVSNQLIYELLVHLLDDDEETLRTTAINTLHKIQGSDLGYNAQLSTQDRRDAVIAWRRWYIELFNPAPVKTP